MYVGYGRGKDEDHYSDGEVGVAGHRWGAAEVAHSIHTPVNENKLSICVLSNKMRLKFTSVKIFQGDEHQFD